MGPGQSEPVGPHQQDKGARHNLLNAFRVADLQQILRAKCLPVAGLKNDLINRLLGEGGMLDESQAKEIDARRI